MNGRIVVVQNSLTAQAQPEAPEQRVVVEETQARNRHSHIVFPAEL